MRVCHLACLAASGGSGVAFHLSQFGVDRGEKGLEPLDRVGEDSACPGERRLPDLVPGGRSSYLTAAVGAQRWATLVLFPGMLFG